MDSIKNGKLIIMRSSASAVVSSSTSTGSVGEGIHNVQGFTGPMAIFVQFTGTNHSAAASASLHIETASGSAAGSDWTAVTGKAITPLNVNTSASTDVNQIIHIGEADELSSFIKYVLRTTGSYTCVISALVNGNSS